MRGIIILIILILITISSCSELQELEARRQQRIRERGYACYVDPYYGTRKCDYLR